MSTRINWLLALSVFLIFEALLLPGLFTKGIFMDGLIYSAVANNMANDIGSIWSPHFSDTVLTPFYEHPPLSIYLHSMLYQLFGDYYWVDKIIGHFFLFLSGIFIIQIYHHFTKSYRLSWLVILLWLSVPNLIWATNNNILENGMTTFILACVYFCLKASEKPFYIILAGLFLSCAFLSKGVFSLYVLSMPFLIWLFLKELTFKKMVITSVLLIISASLPLITLYYTSEGAHDFFNYYFNHQVFKGVKEVEIVDSRFSIWRNFFSNGIMMIGITAIIYFITIKKKIALKNVDKKTISLLITLCFLGIAPIMISLKQREFYIISVYPFLAIALSLFLNERLKHVAILTPTKFKNLSLSILGIAVIVFISTILFYPKGNIGRDKEIIELVEEFNHKVDSPSNIFTGKKKNKNWSLHGYFARHGSHSLTTIESDADFILQLKKNDNLSGQVFIETDDYKIYKK